MGKQTQKPLDEHIAKMEALVGLRDKKIARNAKVKKLVQWITAIVIFFVSLVGAVMNFIGGNLIPGIGYLIVGFVLAFLFYVASGFVLGFMMLKADAQARSEKVLLESQIKEMKKRNH